MAVFQLPSSEIEPTMKIFSPKVVDLSTLKVTATPEVPPHAGAVELGIGAAVVEKPAWLD